MPPHPKFDGSLLRVLAHSGHTGGRFLRASKIDWLSFAVEALARLHALVAIRAVAPRVAALTCDYTILVTEYSLQESCYRNPVIAGQGG